jgi:MFS family permease
MKDNIRNRIFTMFLIANILLNYDTGVIPVSLLNILKEVELNFKEQALLGSLVYLGLSFASLFVSLLFERFGPAKTCSIAILLNSISCFIFSFSSNKMILFFSRFLMGISESFIVIYGPVWVNNYSPKKHSAKWMGILHSVSALGVILGYIFAGVVINFFSEYLSWRFAIQIQGIFQIPVSLYFYYEKEEYININLNYIEKKDEIKIITEENASNLNEDINDYKTKMNNKNNINIINNENNINNENKIKENQSQLKKFKSHNHIFNTKQKQDNLQLKEKIDKDIIDSRNMLSLNIDFEKNLNRRFSHQNFNSREGKDKRLDVIQTKNIRNYCGQVIDILCNPLYMTTCLALCSIYFILTGIQFWMTIYLTDILGNDPIIVMIIFSLVSITAPLGGVLVGGTFADAYGGYRGKNALKALKLCSAFGVIAFIFAFPLGFLYSLIYITVLLWAFLFFGAAIVPVSTGIMVSSVRRDSQAVSSSFSQLIFNLFGYFSSPILTGIIMDLFEDKVEGFKWG